MVSEISGAPLLKMRLPDSVAMANAALLTWVADLVKTPPGLEMALDQYGGMKEGSQGDGSKAEWGDHSLLKNVGRAYTVEQALPWHLLGKLIDGFPPRAMHGHNVIRAYLLYGLNGWLNDGLKNWPRNRILPGDPIRFFAYSTVCRSPRFRV